MTIYDFIHHTSEVEKPKNVGKDQEQIQAEVYAYKVAKANVDFVLAKV